MNLNASFKRYHPHLTLSHTQEFSLIENLKKLQVNIEDDFYMTLGLSGLCGWLVKTLRENKIIEKIL